MLCALDLPVGDEIIVEEKSPVSTVPLVAQLKEEGVWYGVPFGWSHGGPLGA